MTTSRFSHLFRAVLVRFTHFLALVIAVFFFWGSVSSADDAGNDPFDSGQTEKTASKDGPDPKKKEEEATPEKSESPEIKVIRREQTAGAHAEGDKTEGDKTEGDKATGDKAAGTPANPDELKATVGEDGKVAFQFRNQGWVELVQWLAEISGQPLDWLELPGDRVNLTSPGRYTVAETRDLFNRYLLARGYVILELDGGLTVAKTAAINPAIVPRVEPAQLKGLMPHTFVRVSLDAQWLSAEKLAEELKPMVSANGRITALSTTNRIEVMDAAINVIQVAELLAQESDLDSREALAPEFKLRYLPAEEAKRLLEQFLGVEKKSAGPMSPEQIQMMQQMEQQRRNNGGQPAPPTNKTSEISIVANTRQNSIIISAPEDRVAIAAEFIKRIDVPSNSLATLSDVQSRVQVFRLASLDPEKLVEIVGEMNILEPSTRIRVDKDNNALIVSGSAADRFIINSLIERLDGSGRSFQVLQLRRLDAGEVAESITFLMGKKKEEQSQSNRRSYYYGYGSNQEEEKKDKDDFRVAANNRYRQVLLWANPMEMEQVESLLVKLGELPPPDGSDRTMRVIDASASPETLEYLKRIQKQWSQLSPNPLELPEDALFQKPAADNDLKTEEIEEPSKEDTKPSDADVAVASNPFTLIQTPADPIADETPPVQSPRQSSAHVLSSIVHSTNHLWMNRQLGRAPLRQFALNSIRRGTCYC